jgi:hypothetical protein
VGGRERAQLALYRGGEGEERALERGRGGRRSFKGHQWRRLFLLSINGERSGEKETAAFTAPSRREVNGHGRSGSSVEAARDCASPGGDAALARLRAVEREEARGTAGGACATGRGGGNPSPGGGGGWMGGGPAAC